MKKILLTIIAVLLLGAGAYYSLQKEEVKTTITGSDSEFSIADTSQITRFFIAQKNGMNHHFVKQKNGKWRVNDKWNADKNMANLILGTISEIKLKVAVLKSKRNMVIKELASRGIKVELYNKEGIMKTFYIGEATSDDKGTYIIMEGSETPYVVHIPRLQGYLTSRFMVNKKAWLDKSIFTSKLKEIVSLSVDYPGNEEQSFAIVRDSSGFKLENTSFEINTPKLHEYLRNYQYKNAVQLPKINDKKALDDSLAQVKPFVIIQIEDENPENSNRVTIYRIDSEENVLCYLNKYDTYAICQLYSFGKLFVTKESFKKVKLDL